ncbi:MAG: Rpn family recombination-promoting nuclease/putative transposase [Lachnospiraceae bacterium]|nr:Rpn family recombination-promoting nuclease/putative transposase [Lachnospiraceae bacterium]
MHNSKTKPPKMIDSHNSECFKTVNLSDFALFLSVMKEKEAYQCILSIILNEPDLEIIEVNVEKITLNKSELRAIRLDAWASDRHKRQFAMEMQNDSNSDFIPKRARYYQGLLDSPILKAGKDTKYRYLPTTAIIFITQKDIFDKDLAMYTFVEKCNEADDLYLEDGTKKIFLNMTSLNGSDELISLLQYMKNSTINNPEIIVHDERIKTLDRIVSEVKESEEWEELSMNLVEQGIEKGIEIGKARGIAEGKARGIAEGIYELLTEIGKVTDDLRDKIMSENNLPILTKWLKLAARSESIDEFMTHM